ncbi:glutathione ABC transporter substrate-binding protein [Candidatus Acetothermia bacterium]|jgi:peptide/nickel transport system substrate-binding protein|nr:glutathione ABC transporter substrate-binding protein [Candidatus Acetothermia bacterium]MCI2427788.1 glutathione ABC transporter substrate-binding protein [Candidatus Acetothermia bacterium]
MNAKTKKLVFISIIVVSLVLSVGLLGAGAGPRYGGRLIIALGVEPPTLDVIRMACSPAATVSQHITQPLVYLDVDGTIDPSLAKSWEVSPDGLVWIIQLRDDVKFHDGTPFNAEAVKFNLDRFLDPASRAPFRFLIARITEVEVAGEFTVKIHLDAPFAPMLAHLSHSFIGMLSPTAVKALGEGVQIVTYPVGTGPFKIYEWVRGERITLVANEDYWGGRPYLDEIVWKIVPEDAARVMMLEAGDVHHIYRVPPMDVPRLEADPAITIVRETSVRVIYVGFNNLMPPFTDVRVRRAINYAINREAIVEYVLGGAGRVATAPIVPAVFGYHTVGPWPYNPERARELLAEAGFPDGFTTRLYHPTGRYMKDVAVTEAVHAFLLAVGIKAELVTMEWAAYLAYLRRPPEKAVHPMYLLGWGCVTLDADYGLFPLFHSGQWPPVGWHLSFYKNPIVDALLDEARITPDLARRKELYAEIIRLIWYDAPWVWLYDEVQINAQCVSVRGLVLHPTERIQAWDAWIDGN